MATILVTEDLDEIMDIIKYAIDNKHTPTILIPCSDDFLMHKSAADLLIHFGIPQNRIGFKYLQLAVVLYLKDPAVSFSKELYPTVAARLGAGRSASVERSIRSVITAAWENRNSSDWDIFPARNTPPPNKHFVATLAQLLG